MKTIVLYGSGKLTKIIIDCYKKGLLEGYKILGCYSKTKENRDLINKELNVSLIDSFDELINLKPDYLVEATNPKATKEILEKTLCNKINVILLSIGALANPDYYNHISEVAKENNVKVHLASGAISGFQVLQTAKLMGLTKSQLTNTKGANRLKNTPLYKDGMDKNNMVAFSGTAYDAIQNLPTGINVGVATALATMGVYDTKIKIQSEPNYVGDSQCIDIECGDEIKAHLDVYSKTPAIAGYSVVALLINLNSSIVF